MMHVFKKAQVKERALSPVSYPCFCITTGGGCEEELASCCGDFYLLRQSKGIKEWPKAQIKKVRAASSEKKFDALAYVMHLS